jgi:hypothetical protein
MDYENEELAEVIGSLKRFDAERRTAKHIRFCENLSFAWFVLMAVLIPFVIGVAFGAHFTRLYKSNQLFGQ